MMEKFTNLKTGESMQPITDKNSNGIKRNIIIGLLTVIVSIGGSLFTTGKETGKQEEKISQMEVRVHKIESNYSNDHDLLIKICTKLEGLEKTVKEIENDLKIHMQPK